MIYMCVYICLLPTYQYLCHDTIVVRFHDDDGLVGLNLTKGIACCHRLTCKCKETRQGTLNRTQASTWHLEPVIPKQSFHYEGFLTLVIMQMNHLSCYWKYMNHPERVQKKNKKKTLLFHWASVHAGNKLVAVKMKGFHWRNKKGYRRTCLLGLWPTYQMKGLINVSWERMWDMETQRVW